MFTHYKQQASLPILSSSEDAKGVPLSAATDFSIKKIKHASYLSQFNLPKSDKANNETILAGLNKVFKKYEVPLGMVNKLLMLSNYHISFIVDDSGSMDLDSDVTFSEASSYVQHRQKDRHTKKLTRWQEVEDRLHAMIDILAYLPANISIRFLNLKDVIVLNHQGKSPAAFAEAAHDMLTSVFYNEPYGGTPLYKAIKASLNSNEGRMMHYVLTDGQPEEGIDQIETLVIERKYPEQNPITFISCTNDDATDWMKALDASALYTAEIDDYENEKKEVRKNQGPALPFKKGFWLLCQLAAAINPHDLDAVDEKDPFTKGTLDNLMGRKLTLAEYESYFRAHPLYYTYKNLFKEFCREDIQTHHIPNTIRYNKLQSKMFEYLKTGNTFSLWKMPTDEGGEYGPLPEAKEEKPHQIEGASPPPPAYL